MQKQKLISTLNRQIMKTIALIPTYGDRQYLASMLDWLNSNNGITETFVKRDTMPRAPASARKELLAEAYAKHGADAYYLMLDDDSVFTDKSNIAAALQHFAEMKGLGIVGIPLALSFPKQGGIVGKGYVDATHCGHCFIVSGKVLEEGITYTEGEYCEDIDFTFEAYKAGFKVILTQRCEIWHHTTPHNANPSTIGVAVVNINEKLVTPQSTFLQRNADLVTAETHILYGIELPKFYSVKATKEAIELHKQNSVKWQ